MFKLWAFNSFDSSNSVTQIPGQLQVHINFSAVFTRASHIDIAEEACTLLIKLNKPLRIHDIFVLKTTENVTFMQFLGYDLIITKDRPNKVSK